MVKIKVAHEKVEIKLKQSEKDRLMLENVVETKGLKVLELENNVKKISCDQCKYVFETKDNFNNLNDVPTTSKCGSCDFESDDERDVKIHTKTTL